MKATLINEFVLDSNVNGATDWVVTFPTKHHYVTATTARAPFKNKLTEKGSCQDTVIVTWNREEGGITPGGPDFSPSPTPDGATICWEANVVTFNGKNIFASKNTLGVNTLFQAGWAEMAFQGASGVGRQQRGRRRAGQRDGHRRTPLSSGMYTFPPQMSSAGTVTFAGLPVVGFAVEAFRPSLSSWYDGVIDHKWQSQDYGFFLSAPSNQLGIVRRTDPERVRPPGRIGGLPQGRPFFYAPPAHPIRTVRPPRSARAELLPFHAVRPAASDGLARPFAGRRVASALWSGVCERLLCPV